MTSSQNSSQHDPLVQRLNLNGEEGLAEAFEICRPRLNRIVEIRLGQKIVARLDAGDILQDAFIKARAKLADFLAFGEVPVFVWLRGIVIDTICEAHRRHLGAQARAVDREVSIDGVIAESEAFGGALLGDSTSPSQAAVREEDGGIVLQALRSMSENDRQILILRQFEELTNDEAASVLGVKKAAASRRYLRALSHLRAAIEKRQTLDQ